MVYKGSLFLFKLVLSFIFILFWYIKKDCRKWFDDNFMIMVDWKDKCGFLIEFWFLLFLMKRLKESWWEKKRFFIFVFFDF